jgi:ribonuclease HII
VTSPDPTAPSTGAGVVAGPEKDLPLAVPADPSTDAAGAHPVSRRRPRTARSRPGGASRGRRLFQHDRALGARWVVGADEAGRGCLAGPLVAGAVLFDLERIGPREVRALGALDDSKAHTAEERERLFAVVLRIAERVGSVSRCVEGLDGRGLHVTNLEALSTAARRVARPGAQ